MELELKIKTTLKNIMKTRGETLTSIAKETGVPKSTVADWLAGRTPNPLQAAKIANYLEVTLYFILFGCEDRQEQKQEKKNENIGEEIISGLFEVSIKRIIKTQKT